MKTILQANLEDATTTQQIRKLLIESYSDFYIDTDVYSELSFIENNLSTAISALVKLLNIDYNKIKNEIEKELEHTKIDIDVYVITSNIIFVCNYITNDIELLKELIKLKFICIIKCDNMAS